MWIKYIKKGESVFNKTIFIPKKPAKVPSKLLPAILLGINGNHTCAIGQKRSYPVANPIHR
ncbi:MAG: hypothetical protein D6730_02335 [Bacteroidetes bacterium]|nr:MAG: hypothetical protein D6730_02335 [Bacteroidota bacterium]